jgi:V-type H+-transporting ATPase subunit a
MGYYNLVIPRENAWNVMNDLADLDCLHFVDYDPELPLMNRPFSNYIKRFFIALYCLDWTNSIIKFRQFLLRSVDQRKSSSTVRNFLL